MTPRKPRITASQVIKAIERKGFQLARQSGSHQIYRNAEGRRVTVPIHGSKILHPKVLASILKEAKITWEELEELLR